MKIAGLTGGIAAGKSTVAAMLRGLGARLIDADLLAREVVRPGTPALAEIAARFGAEMIAPDGTLDRKRLGALVFQDDTAREALNHITHPRIAARIQEELARAEAEGAPAAFVEAALLFEAQWDQGLPEVWLVAIPEEEQLRRLMQRDGFTEPEARARIQAQLPLEEKRRRARVIIENHGPREETARHVEGAYRALLSR